MGTDIETGRPHAVRVRVVDYTKLVRIAWVRIGAPRQGGRRELQVRVPVDATRVSILHLPPRVPQQTPPTHPNSLLVEGAPTPCPMLVSRPHPQL